MPGRLYVVSTPIGNLEDITYRAVRVLKEVDWIACEDTRTTRHLLDHYGIPTRTISYHDHNETERAAELFERLKQGETGAPRFRRRNAAAFRPRLSASCMRPSQAGIRVEAAAGRRLPSLRRWSSPAFPPISFTSAVSFRQNKDSAGGCSNRWPMSPLR